MLNRAKLLPSSCRACGSLGSPCRPCQTENGTSWVMFGSSLGAKVNKGNWRGLTSVVMLRTRRGTEDCGLLSGDL